ncbi:hTAFII28-like protein conserved region-domain-containing protein [Podospora appendiculata]|uniref:HTAFII28-like protein conserved region-domain-containing protein n=1 Tax=Podospora appendiculata TaxID=314037 RepID=A0AAE0X743_9PEZI|nr:hTAFII28-like protein conserved region-domain-containing protein [Podospora appendiculata]
MASPPYAYSPTALSPPSYASHAALPPINTMSSKKRGSEGGASPALKRRKASAISISSAAGSAHPLRQTSFPPESNEYGMAFDARSPSVDLDAMSYVSGSQVSAAGPPKKKRGRKSKADKAREQTPSAVGGRAATAASDGRGAKSAAGGVGGGGAEEGEADDEGPTEVAATANTMTKEQKEEEHRARGMLINAFNKDQFDRFENWRAANLSKAGVRRLINATISQSVTENVVIGMRAVAKVFIGDIIESARRVQGEWIEKTDEKQTDLPTPPASAATSPKATTDGAEGAEGEKKKDNGDEDAATVPLPPQVEPPRGPLRPEHIREAIRRYKMSQEGGGVGMQGLWHLQQQNGVDRFPTRTGGRRIFR